MIGNMTGASNTASGFESLSSNLDGNWNTAEGMRALRFNYGSYNTGVGGILCIIIETHSIIQQSATMPAISATLAGIIHSWVPIAM